MKKGFTLIELLAVIVILAVIALIATPIILGVVENARKSAAGSSALGYLDAVEKAIALDGLDNIVYPIGDIDILTSEYYKDVEVQGDAPSKGNLVVNDTYIIESATLCINSYKVEVSGHKIKKITKNACDDIKQKKFVEFGKDNSGASYPKLKGDLIPVVYDGENWLESDGSQEHWYNYDDKKWANAVILTEDGEVNDDGTIDEAAIDAFFVWIPKYRYKLWNVTDYTVYGISNPSQIKSSSKIIDIEFNLENTSDTQTTCAATNKSGDIGTCKNDMWMTHPAFINFDVDGFWVGKFEMTGTASHVTIKPSQKPLQNQNFKSLFELAYNYDASQERILESHMIKNTEWGAVAYLSHSKYGIGKEVGINNYEDFMTGCGGEYVPENDSADVTSKVCNNYKTELGMNASTTGNIYGIYDMSGGAFEYVAGYLENKFSESGFDATSVAKYNPKYFDVYTNPSNNSKYYANRILGDATAELGPFYEIASEWKIQSGWYADGAWTVWDPYSVYDRGGTANNNNFCGLFYFHYDLQKGVAGYDTSRIVMSPK